jgi:RNA polymerase sigma-70 factor (ECF subfamily)
VDAQARLGELLAPLHDAARRTARRLSRCDADGDDLFHEAVLRALDRLPQLRDPTRFRSWFYAVLLSVHRARWRRRFWRRLIPFDDAPPRAAPDWEEERARADRMAHALAQLSPRLREAIVLSELDGFSLEEVASLQRATLSAVKSRVARARERLRRHYQELDAVPRAALKGETQ